MARIDKIYVSILVVKGLKLTIMSESGHVVWMPEFNHLHVSIALVQSIVRR